MQRGNTKTLTTADEEAGRLSGRTLNPVTSTFPPSSPRHSEGEGKWRRARWLLSR